jgi:hypothetical protein
VVMLEAAMKEVCKVPKRILQSLGGKRDDRAALNEKYSLWTRKAELLSITNLYV